MEEMGTVITKKGKGKRITERKVILAVYKVQCPAHRQCTKLTC